jgi:hypothetical protein
VRAEIGFVRDEQWQPTPRLRLTVYSQSETESSALQMFAQRLGVRLDDASGTLTIEEKSAP